jgi:hypothetical protein
MMKISADQWADEMDVKNYDQAWSMVHFLVHGDDGKYQDALGRCINEISHHKSFDRAWMESFGPSDGFEARWKNWWTNQPESPTRILYAHATVATMTSFIARAWVQKQQFKTFGDFKKAVDADELRISEDDWLPPALIKSNMHYYGSLPTWEIATGDNNQPTVTLTIADGSCVTGTFTPRGTQIDQVNIDVDDLARVLKDAQVQLDAGKKDTAKTMVQSAFKLHPKSPSAGDAKKFLQALN